MSDIDDGGPAFPVMFRTIAGLSVDGGMTLRQHYAAKAMQGCLSTSQWDTSEDCLQNMVRYVFRVSDAMIWHEKQRDSLRQPVRPRQIQFCGLPWSDWSQPSPDGRTKNDAR